MRDARRRAQRHLLQFHLLPPPPPGRPAHAAAFGALHERCTRAVGRRQGLRLACPCAGQLGCTDLAPMPSAAAETSVVQTF